MLIQIDKTAQGFIVQTTDEGGATTTYGDTVRGMLDAEGFLMKVQREIITARAALAKANLKKKEFPIDRPD